MTEITIPKMDYKKLFEPYTRDGNTFENSIRYLRKEATARGVEFLVVDLAVQEIMMEVQNGREFPLDCCPCGCESRKAGTAITHAMRAKMFELDEALQGEIIKICEQTANQRIAVFVKKEKKYQKQEKKKAKKQRKEEKKLRKKVK